MFDLAARRLYLCVGAREDMPAFLAAVLRGGVDVVQLREELGPEEQLAMARIMAPLCRDFSVPFVMNDSPELALAAHADGVHVGQDDASVAQCREVLGEEAIVGLSTHSREEFDAALTQAATYYSAGPLEPTPTKPGRPGTGLAYAVECATRSPKPVFITGGISEHNVASLVTAGLRHFVVVRALTEAPDPEAAARRLRAALDEALAVAVEPT